MHCFGLDEKFRMKGAFQLAKINERDFGSEKFTLTGISSEDLLRYAEQWSRRSPYHAWTRHDKEEKTFLLGTPQGVRRTLEHLRAFSCPYSVSLQGCILSRNMNELRWFMHTDHMYYGGEDFDHFVSVLAEGDGRDDFEDYSDLLEAHIDPKHVFYKSPNYIVELTSVKVHIPVPPEIA